MLNKRLVLDVGRIFREREVFGVKLILRRLGRSFLADLSRRLGSCQFIRCVFFGLFRIRDLKLFWDLSKRRDKLHINLPGLAEHFGRAIGS